MDLRQSLSQLDGASNSFLEKYKEAKKMKAVEVADTYESMFPILDVKTHDLAIGETLAACFDLKTALQLREKYVSSDFDESFRSVPIRDERPDYENIKPGEEN